MSRTSGVPFRPFLVAIALVGAPGSVSAQEAVVPTQPQISVTADAPVAAAAETAADTSTIDVLPWTATLSAGMSKREGGSDGSWQAISLSRAVGQGYVRAGIMRYHGTLVQTDTALPSDYYVATLGAGGNFGGWVLDGWASYGVQDYGRVSGDAGSRESDGAKSSGYYAFGGDFGRVLTLGQNWYLTPTVAASFANGKLLRPAPGPYAHDIQTAEPTWSANATLRLDRALAGGKHDLGLTFSRNWTSNGVSLLQAHAQTDATGATTYDFDSDHRPDWWYELGATASFSLSARFKADLYVSHSFGVLAGDQTSGGLSLRRLF